jgi:hypothetical protein
MLVIEQPDRTMALVPEWMTKPAAAAVEIREAPRFRLAELGALRQVAGAVLSLLSDRSNGGWHGISPAPARRELFPRAATNTSLPPAVIERLLHLVGQLLTETAAAELVVTERVDEHQDHA